MRAFLQLRALLPTHEDLRRKINEMEKRYDSKFQVVFATLRQMLETPIPPKKQIEFISVRSRLAAATKCSIGIPNHWIYRVYLSTSPFLQLEKIPHFQ